MVKKLEFPVKIRIVLAIQGKSENLISTANKIDIYKNNITTRL